LWVVDTWHLLCALCNQWEETKKEQDEIDSRRFTEEKGREDSGPRRPAIEHRFVSVSDEVSATARKRSARRRSGVLPVKHGHDDFELRFNPMSATGPAGARGARPRTPSSTRRAAREWIAPAGGRVKAGVDCSSALARAGLAGG